MIECSETDCDASILGDKWSKIKSGWFFSKDGKRFCLKHIPPWVEEWRKK